MPDLLFDDYVYTTLINKIDNVLKFLTRKLGNSDVFRMRADLEAKVRQAENLLAEVQETLLEEFKIVEGTDHPSIFKGILVDNSWDHLNNFLEVYKLMTEKKWSWGRNHMCKYIDLRIDMRDGGCLIEAKGVSPIKVRLSQKKLDERQSLKPFDAPSHGKG